MGTTERTGLVAMLLAVTSLVWFGWVSITTGSASTLHLALIGVLPTALAGVAALALMRHDPFGSVPALAYVGVYAAGVSAGLPAVIGAARFAGDPGIAWSLVAITVLGAVTLVAAAKTWWSLDVGGPGPARLSRVVATAGGLCLAVSFFLPRITAPAGGRISAPIALLEGGVLTRLSAAILWAVVVGATAVVGRGADRRLWSGVVAGLAGTHVIAVASVFDPTIEEVGAELASGTFVAVAGVATLVLGLVLEVRRRGPVPSAAPSGSRSEGPAARPTSA